MRTVRRSAPRSATRCREPVSALSSSGNGLLDVSINAGFRSSRLEFDSPDAPHVGQGSVWPPVVVTVIVLPPPHREHLAIGWLSAIVYRAHAAARAGHVLPMPSPAVFLPKGMIVEHMDP